MPKSMGGNILFDASLFNQFFQNQEDHHTGKLRPSPVQKKNILMSGFDRDMHTDILSIDIDILDGRFSYWHQPLLIPFANDPDKTDINIQIRQFKVHYLAYPQSAAIHGFK